MSAPVRNRSPNQVLCAAPLTSFLLTSHEEHTDLTPRDG